MSSASPSPSPHTPSTQPTPPLLPSPTSSLPTSPTTFTALVNTQLFHLSNLHTNHLTNRDDQNLLATTRHAETLRDAAVVYTAAADILPSLCLRDDPRSVRLTAYIRDLSQRLAQALHDNQYENLAILVKAAQTALDQLDKSAGLFDRLAVVPISADRKHVGIAVQRPAESDSAPPRQSNADGEWPEPPAEEVKGAYQDAERVKCRPFSVCGLAWKELPMRERFIVWLYFVMVIGAFLAVTAVTVDFINQINHPGSFIRSTESAELRAPVVTVCLSQAGVPASRLQLFNFTDAEGRLLQGGLPSGTHGETQSQEFAEVVERFWDNPLGEDCDAKVGDYYPFPLQSLNRIISGEETTQCRPCFRVGDKREAMVRSTDFRNSSALELYTDNYFLQCVKNKRLTQDSLDRLHDTVMANLEDMERFQLLSASAPGKGVRNLTRDEVGQIDSQQCCNLFYFGFFPRTLDRGTADVDIRYNWDGMRWSAVGNGPYLNLNKGLNVLPEESLQMFVSTNRSTEQGKLGKDRDMILIGPNTQTFATFRPIVVYDIDRYDISSSTSNLRETDVIALFGYWLVYRIYYTYNRFVVDEWYRESTYPPSQWVVDVTGYLSLFTGASLFSLLLLPLLRAVRRREKQNLLRQQPEAYLWSRHKKHYDQARGGATSNADLNTAALSQRSSVRLPGYNV